MALPVIKIGTALLLAQEVQTRLEAALHCLEEKPRNLGLAAVLLADCLEIVSRSLPFPYPPPAGNETGMSCDAAALLLRNHVEQLQSFSDRLFQDGNASQQSEQPVRLLLGTMITVNSILQSPTFREAKSYWTTGQREEARS